MNLNGYPQEEVQEYFASLPFNERARIEANAQAHNLHPYEATANHMQTLDKAYDEALADARRIEAVFTDETPISADTLKKVLRKVGGNTFNKARRYSTRQILGDSRYQAFMNPQRRDTVALTQGEGIQILNIR